MARKIKLNQIGDYCNQQLEQLLRVAVLETDARLKQASPVDLGRFRASWQVGENNALGGIVPEGSYPQAPPITRIGYQKERIGNIYSVHNNLPYAEKLAAASPGSGSKTEIRYNPRRTVKNWASPGDGSSIQTNGPGWVQGVAKDIQQFVRINADRIGRQS
jgi:hypothetical protein